MIYIYQLLNNFKHFFIIGNVGVSTYCKHTPSCSRYMANQIKTKGLIKGGLKGIKRILTCY